MAEQISPEFSHEALEADIKRLAAEIQGYKERPEAKTLSGQELVKRSLRVFPDLSSQPQQPQGESTQSPGPLAPYVQDVPREVRLEVEYLVDLALHKGIHKALGEAKKSGPFVLDAFHDALAGKLYPELKKRGLVD